MRPLLAGRRDQEITNELRGFDSSVIWRCFRLDVSADNDRAIELYSAAGVGARRARAGMTRLAMTLEL